MDGPTQDPPRVWIVDREQWPRACLRAELEERGYDATGFVDLDAALEALAALDGAPGPHPRAIVLELRGQDLEAPRLAALERTGVPVLALAGARELADPVAQSGRWARLLTRPVTLGAVADAAEALVHRQ